MFTDAQKVARMYPDTFWVPDLDDLLTKVKPGSLVKVCVSDERFWCIVNSIEDAKITATIDNDLLNTDMHGLNFGDIITFIHENIYNHIEGHSQ